jgi:photosystem II stability/assembly factor-like uncharacterized protein
MKKALFLTITIVLILSVFTLPAHAQDIVRWEPSNGGIENQEVFVLKLDPVDSTVIYAGTVNGIFKTTNAGLSWSPINNGITVSKISAIAIDPSNRQSLLIATVQGFVYKSTNGGSNWTKLYELPESYNYFLSLAIDNGDPLTIYAGGYEDFFKSVDGGVSWQRAQIGDYAGVFDILIDPSQNKNILIATDDGIYKSIDYGETWDLKTTQKWVECRAFAMDMNNQNVIFGATAGNGVIKSVDGGETWEYPSPLDLPNYIYAISFDSTYSKLYAGHWFRGAYMSDDGGLTWQEINEGLPENSPSVLLQNPNNPGSVYAGTSQGVYKLVILTSDKQLFIPLIFR